MQQRIFTIEYNKPVAENIYRLRLVCGGGFSAAPGQFASLSVPGFFLRRPFSLCAWDEKGFELVYRALGEGTDKLSAMQPGETVDVLAPLGKGYDLEKSGERPLLIGGGMGATPLLMLCRELVSQGKKPTVLLGFASAADAILLDDFAAAGAEPMLCSDDGSLGRKGFVTGLMADIDHTYFYTCGPEAMFRAIDKIARSEGQFSLEARMGCGFGACVGCSIETKNGSRRVCKDGPVFESEELIW